MWLPDHGGVVGGGGRGDGGGVVGGGVVVVVRGGASDGGGSCNGTFKFRVHCVPPATVIVALVDVLLSDLPEPQLRSQVTPVASLVRVTDDDDDAGCTSNCLTPSEPLSIVIDCPKPSHKAPPVGTVGGGPGGVVGVVGVVVGDVVDVGVVVVVGVVVGDVVDVSNGTSAPLASILALFVPAPSAVVAPCLVVVAPSFVLSSSSDVIMKYPSITTANIISTLIIFIHKDFLEGKALLYVATKGLNIIPNFSPTVITPNTTQ